MICEAVHCFTWLGPGPPPLSSLDSPPITSFYVTLGNWMQCCPPCVTFFWLSASLFSPAAPASANHVPSLARSQHYLSHHKLTSDLKGSRPQRAESLRTYSTECYSKLVSFWRMHGWCSHKLPQNMTCLFPVAHNSQPTYMSDLYNPNRLHITKCTIFNRLSFCGDLAWQPLNQRLSTFFLPVFFVLLVCWSYVSELGLPCPYQVWTQDANQRLHNQVFF